ncbi:hypothetical protein ACFYYQ_27380, partial [Streptomyces albidoflavus]
TLTKLGRVRGRTGHELDPLSGNRASNRPGAVHEDHQLRFDQHTRPYRAVDVLRLESLLRQLTTEGKLHLLGDPEWVGRAAAYLAGGKNRWITNRALQQVTAEALAAAGPGSP